LSELTPKSPWFNDFWTKLS